MREIVDISGLTLAQRRFDVKGMGQVLEQAYLDSRREPSDRAKVSFAPSGVGYKAGTCPRQWFYAFTGGVVREDDTDAMGVANMAYGTEAHERIQGLFEKSGILVEKERELRLPATDTQPPIGGYVDLIVDWQGEEVVGEIKTTMQESFVSKQAKGRGAGYHIIQLLIYMKALGKEKGFLLYENKNLQQMLIVPVTMNVENKKLADDTWDWMIKTYKNWQNGTLPKRPFRTNSVVCKACPFKKHCWEGEEGVVSLPVLEVPK